MNNKLAVTARYRLRSFLEGPRTYSTKDHQLWALYRRGFLAPLTTEVPEDQQTWVLTKAGMEALSTNDADDDENLN